MERRDFIRASAFCAAAGAVGGAPASLVAQTAAPVRLGIDVLADSGFALLQGRRVGLVTHRAGVNGQGRRSADVLARACSSCSGPSTASTASRRPTPRWATCATRAPACRCSPCTAPPASPRPRCWRAWTTS
ncbi:MAG: twin-arginine translocation signal domain-containing protein [Opitutia bacterium]